MVLNKEMKRPAIFDVIVVGLGAMGSAAAYHLSGRGQTVLGLEAFQPAHDKGSSHGSSRIIRQAYFEDPCYVPLLFRAYELWERLQAETGADLLRLTGGLMIGPPASDVVAGSIQSAREYGLEHEVLRPDEVRRRFPPFVLAPDEAALYERKAGFLRPEECIRQHLAVAARQGADLRFEEPMQSWRAEPVGGEVMVTTGKGTYRGRSLVLSGGPWMPEILASLRLPLGVHRRVMFWFDPLGGIGPFLPEQFPVYLWHPTDAPVFYGFPATGGQPGVKVAIHTGQDGTEPNECTPETIDRSIRESDEQAMRRLIANRIPALNGPRLDARTCMYTMTPDEHFILDRHPEFPQVSIAAGFSGHGFKFASVVGEILADLATDGRTRHEIGRFSIGRFDRSAEAG
jgi:sarcosine oxidase